MTCSPETTLLSASVRSEPGGQIGRAAEIKQRLGQGLELLQRQSLDAGGGGLAQGAAAAVELAKCHLGLALGLTPIQKVLGGAGVEQLFGGDAKDYYGLPRRECRKPPKRRSENDQIADTALPGSVTSHH